MKIIFSHYRHINTKIQCLLSCKAYSSEWKDTEEGYRKREIRTLMVVWWTGNTLHSSKLRSCMLNLSAHLMQFQVNIFLRNCLRFWSQKYGIMCELIISKNPVPCVFTCLEAVFFCVFSCSYTVAHSEGHRTHIELILSSLLKTRRTRTAKYPFW